MPIDPRIALGVQPLQVADPMARYSQLASIQSAQNQNALAQYQLSAAQRSDEQQNKLYAASQQPKFKLDFASAIKYGAPGLAAFKAQEEAAAAGLTRTETRGKIDKQKVDLLDSKLKQSRSFLDTLNPADPNAPAAYLRWHEANHADPLIGPALKARGVTVDQSRAQIQAAIDKGPQAFADLINGSKLGTEKFMELNKPSTTVVDQSGQKQMFQTPGLGGPPKSVGTYADVPLPANVLAQKKDIARAGASNITMSTEKKYGEQFAGKMADRDDAKLGAAEKAPQLAESANRIIGLVNQGNLFTGPVADVKLNIARALNVVGADNDAKIANTELLISATGQSTLDAIKSAGLGTGQGFTDKDLRFLQGVAGGTITYTAETLMELARLQHLAAVRSVEAWSTRLKQIPKSSIEGLGIPTEPIKVPPLSSKVMFATNPKTGERRQSVDGGANWTPVGGK
jgi:hypothetical protein